MTLKVRQVNLRVANKFVHDFHRHHKPDRGYKFAIGCFDNDKLVGVAICGRPKGRKIDHTTVLEVTRLCTDGTKNACSKLYAACARVAKGFGYEKIITYTLQSESGITLKATGWDCEGEAGGKSWDVPSRRRSVTTRDLFGEENKYPEVKKTRWAKTLAA